MTEARPRPDSERVLQALGDPTRRRIVEALSVGPMSVSALAAPFDMSLTAIVQHLRVLEESGLVATEKVGRVRTCRLDSAGLDTLQRWIEDRRTLWDRRLDRLSMLVDEISKSGDDN
jgi:DNA-binding transcriptional ArsR family regulator